MSGLKLPKVAVITRTKNRTNLLDRAIKSVHSQTMTDFVHVIINDGGDKKLVENLVKKHKNITKNRVKLLHNETSLGVEVGSNRAIKSVNSTFIAIHDDDDTWHPDFLLETTKQLENSGAMGVVVTTDNIIEDLHPDGSVTFVRKERWIPDLKEISLYRQCFENLMTPITFLYRREVFKKIGYYNEDLTVCGDWDFGIRFIVNYDVDFLDTEVALANYHHRNYMPGAEGNSVFAGNNLDKKYINYLMNKYLREDLKKGSLGIGYIINEIRYRNEQEGSSLLKLEDRLANLGEQIRELEAKVVERTSIGKRIKSMVGKNKTELQ